MRAAGQEIHIGTLPLTGLASFGIDAAGQATAVDERNEAGVPGARPADAPDDAADNQKGEAAARHFATTPPTAVVATSIAASPSLPRRSMTAAAWSWSPRWRRARE